MKVLDYLIKPLGLKRKLAVLLAIITELARTNPKLNPLISIVEQIAGYLGIAGLAHVAIDKDPDKLRDAALSIASLLAGLIAVAHFIPQLDPFMPALYKLSAIIGAYSLGKGMTKIKKAKK